MALTRNFLKALGIEEEKIGEIINAHSETVTALKADIEKYKEDAEKLYPSLFFGMIDDAKKQLDEGLKKYRTSGVGEEAIKKAEEEVKKRHKKLDSYRDEMYGTVELHHPDHPDRVRKGLKELWEKYTEEFGNFPTRAKLGNPDLLGQMEMEIT